MKRRILSAMMACSMLASLSMPTAVYADQDTQDASTHELRNVMYYGDWSIWGGQGNFYPTDMPADLYTHLNYAFMDFDAAGNLIFCDPDAAAAASLGQAGVTWGDVNSGLLPALTSLRAENPNMKIGISVGGWSKSGDFSDMAANDVARANFVDQIVKFVEYTGMDFVDIDWEYPASVREPDFVDNKGDEGTPDAKPEDKENYITLLSDIRNALDASGAEIGKSYELSVSLPISQTKLADGIDVDAMFDIIDFGNLMTYDARGAWDEYSGHQTALYGNPEDPMYDYGFSIDQVVQYMLEEGAPSEKIVIGAAFYSRGWEEVNDDAGIAGNPGLFGSAEIANLDADQSPSRGASNEAALSNGDGGRNGGIWSYRSMDALNAAYPGLVEYWDDVAKAPYLYNGEAFFTYDNEESVGLKAEYAVENNLGGVITWMASNDAPTDSTQRDALTKSIYEGLYGTADLPDNEIIVTPLDISVSVSTYSESWSGSGYEITITNNEKAEESNTVLKTVEAQKETIMLPKLYIDNNGIDLASGGYGAGTITNANGITEIDLAAVYDNKLIPQGSTVTLKYQYVGSDEVSLDNLNSITLTQRTTTTGPEFNPQVIYGATTGEAVNTAPVISGTGNKTIEFGAEFDVLAGVTATDKEDGNLTSSIKVTGVVNTSVAGTYVLTYTVTDSQGATTTASRTVVVEIEIVEPEVKPEEEVKPEPEPEVEDEEVTPDAGTLDFGVGQGIEWETGVFAPFADMGAWVSGDYSNSGALDLGQVMDETGIKYFNLGFINAVDGTVGADGVLNWGFGGYSVLNEDNAATNEQYNGIKKAISDVRANGGDVVISIGGLNEKNFFQSTSDVDVLVNTYVEIIDGFNLTRIDLDIEGGAQGYAMNEANAEAMKIVQDKTGVEVVLTLPVLPTGLTTNLGLPTLQAYVDAGVDVEVVNIMAMCYGVSFGDYADASVDAIDSTMQQIKDSYASVGITLTDAEAYNKVGITTSIGFEGSAHPIFTTADSAEVVEAAAEREINFVSFWSINRDSETQTNSGIYGQYEHTNVYLGFQDGSIVPETPETEEDKTLYTLTFELNGGVGTYEDQILAEGSSPVAPTEDPTRDGYVFLGWYKDGNLTRPMVFEEYEIYWSGTVFAKWTAEVNYTLSFNLNGGEGYFPTQTLLVNDNPVAPTTEPTKDGYVFDGWYRDSKLTTPMVFEEYNMYQNGSVFAKWVEAEEVPEVPEVPEVEDLPELEDGTTWNRTDEGNGLYTPGTIVSYKGVTYEQVSSGTSWWCEPGTDSSVWKAIGSDSSYVAPAIAWTEADQAAGVHTPGTLVTYEGVTYKQVSTNTSWWCVPGTNSSVWLAQ